MPNPRPGGVTCPLTRKVRLAFICYNRGRVEANFNASLTSISIRPSTYYAHNSVGGSPVTIQKAAYSYGNDGKVKEIDNQRGGANDTTFDQRNVYDFAGRLKKNAMGANDYTFNQTLGYDAFNNLTSRDNYFYAFFDNYSTPNNKRDKAGNVVEDISIGVTNQLPEPGGGRTYTDTKTWNYDAAGRMAYWHEHGPWGDDVEDGKGETLFYDGDGRPVGKYVSLGFEYYSLVSSVTGKRVIDVVASGSTSEPFGMQVYLGDTLIYDQTYRGENDGDFVYGLGYRLTDPITGGLQQMHADGTIPSQTTYPYARTELAGLGTSIPLEAPQSFPEPAYGSGGFPGNAGSGCRIDGFDLGPRDCDQMAAFSVQCPNNNCAPVRFIDHRTGKESWTLPFSSDGHLSGYRVRVPIWGETGTRVIDPEEGEEGGGEESGSSRIGWGFIEANGGSSIQHPNRHFTLKYSETVWHDRARRFLADNKDCADFISDILDKLQQNSGIALEGDINYFIDQLEKNGTMFAMPMASNVMGGGGIIGPDYGTPGWGIEIGVNSSNKFYTNHTIVTYLGELIHAIGRRGGISHFGDVQAHKVLMEQGMAVDAQEYKRLMAEAGGPTDYSESRMFHNIMSYVCGVRGSNKRPLGMK